jgi:hypothetical protein
MSLRSVGVILNALRLGKSRLGCGERSLVHLSSRCSTAARRTPRDHLVSGPQESSVASERWGNTP